MEKKIAPKETIAFFLEWTGFQKGATCHFNNSALLSLTYTVNPLYTDTRYNDKIRYNDNLNVTKPSMKR